MGPKYECVHRPKVHIKTTCRLPVEWVGDLLKELLPIDRIINISIQEAILNYISTETTTSYLRISFQS